MSNDNLSQQTVEKLVSAYREAAYNHGLASSRGDPNVANTQHDVLASIYRELRTREPGQERALLVLLDTPDRAVRGWVGAHALEFAPEIGEQVLRALSATDDLVGFNAELTLETWERGELCFP